MSVIDKTKHAVLVAEKHGFKSIVSIYASKFDFIPTDVFLEDVTELTGFDCHLVDDGATREVFTKIDGVKFSVVLKIEECAAS